MELFFAEVAGLEGQGKEFYLRFHDQVMPGLRNLGIVAEAWSEEGGQNSMAVLGWAKAEQSQEVAGIFKDSGLKVNLRRFSALSPTFAGLGLPRRTAAVLIGTCDMPYNGHNSDDFVTCQVHNFSPNHNITNCPVCGGQLKSV